MSDRAPETPQQRRERFLRSADEAEAYAQEATTPLTRDLCLYVAKSWRQMAAELEDIELRRTMPYRP